MRLSIITINYNNAKGLDKTVESVLSQTYANIDYLIIDGGSTDDSVEVIKRNQKRISYWISEKDKGVYNAMNKGIMAAKGDYLLFLNSGDYLCNPNVIESLLKDAGEADLIYGNLERTFPDGTNDVVKMPSEITVERMITGTLCHPVTLIKRTLFERFGLYDENLKIVADWAFFLKVIVLGNAKCKYKDIDVSVFSMDGLSSKLSNAPLLSKERQKVLDDYLSPSFVKFYNEKLDIQYYHKRYRIEQISFILMKVKRTIRYFFSFLPLSSKWLNYNKLTLKTELELEAYKNKKSLECFQIPIIINNRNQFTYLKQLIASLEKRGYKNIYILDNNSDYPPLLEYYQEVPYKVYLLGQNVGFCALWDTIVFQDFKDQYYVYTDSDLEIIDECPDDFMVVMHYLLNKYEHLGKVGFSLLTNDLPEHYSNREEVVKWEAKWSEEKIEKLAYKALIDTTFALYKPNKFGHAVMLPALRTSYPYSARHLPWYENSFSLTEEQRYYYEHASTSSHWSDKAKKD